VDLIAQAPYRNTKDAGCPRPVPFNIVESLKDDDALDFGQGMADKLLSNRVVEWVRVGLVESKVFR
jgi:hypothetical protein